MRSRVALGLRAHSGWAAFVALEAPLTCPAVIERGRVELADPKDTGSIQPYHAAERLPLPEAERLLARYVRSAEGMALRGLGEVLRRLRGAGHTVAGCGLLMGSGRSGSSLATTLASHALIHSADGSHFRQALGGACKRHGIDVVRIPERELLVRGGRMVGASTEQLRSRLADLGGGLGPPWRQDEKYAALAAWLVLGEREKRPWS